MKTIFFARIMACIIFFGNFSNGIAQSSELQSFINNNYLIFSLQKIDNLEDEDKVKNLCWGSIPEKDRGLFSFDVYQWEAISIENNEFFLKNVAMEAYLTFDEKNQLTLSEDPDEQSVWTFEKYVWKDIDGGIIDVTYGLISSNRKSSVELFTNNDEGINSIEAELAPLKKRPELRISFTPKSSKSSSVNAGILDYSVYPNPVTGESFFCQVKSFDKALNMVIYDAKGKIIKSVQLNSVLTEVSAQDLPVGSYSLLFQDVEEDVVGQIKLVIVK